MKSLIGLAAIAFVFVATVSFAQQPPQTPSAPGHQMPMQGGICPMMVGGGMMGGGMPMMGMMGSQPESARTMQMRGEMMKAMGDVLTKYGKMMEGAK